MVLFACNEPHAWYEQLLSLDIVKNNPHNSKHFIDWYTLTHFFWQFLFAFLSIRFLHKYLSSKWILIIGIIYSTLFEYLENTKDGIQKFRRLEIDKSGKTSYRGDSIINIIGDILANILGLYIGLIIGRNTGISIFLITGILIHVIDPNYYIEFFGFLKYNKN